MKSSGLLPKLGLTLCLVPFQPCPLWLVCRTTQGQSQGSFCHTKFLEHSGCSGNVLGEKELYLVRVLSATVECIGHSQMWVQAPPKHQLE